MVDDPRIYYLENCYALRGCLHCPDCLAFALKFYRLAESLKKKNANEKAKRSRTLVTKFILSTIASENLPCEYAISSVNLKDYINMVIDGEAELPHCHYEFR